MKKLLAFFVVHLLLAPVAAHSADHNATKMMATQQAQILQLQKTIQDLQKQVNGLTNTLKSQYTTTEDLQKNYIPSTQKSTLVSKGDFASVLANATGISCNDTSCDINRYLKVVPPGLGRSIHIPESWGSHQPYVYCDSTNCYALLKW